MTIAFLGVSSKCGWCSTGKHVARLAAALLIVAVFPVTASAVPDEVTIREAVDAAVRPIMTEDKVPG